VNVVLGATVTVIGIVGDASGERTPAPVLMNARTLPLETKFVSSPKAPGEPADEPPPCEQEDNKPTANRSEKRARIVNLTGLGSEVRIRGESERRKASFLQEGFTLSERDLSPETLSTDSVVFVGVPASAAAAKP